MLLGLIVHCMTEIYSGKVNSTLSGLVTSPFERGARVLEHAHTRARVSTTF